MPQLPALNPPVIRTSIGLPEAIMDKAYSTMGVGQNLHFFMLAATDAYIASGTQPISNRALSRILDSKVYRVSPATFAPSRRSGRMVSHYKAVAKSHGVSLSALVSNAMASALNMLD